MKQNMMGSRPKESVFYEPMVYLLGRLSGFKPYVGVPGTLVQDDVLRLAGFNPTIVKGKDGEPDTAVALDGDGNAWPLRSTSSEKRDGLYRVVSFGWYHQTRQYRPDSDAPCAKPMLPALDMLEEAIDEILGVSPDEAETLRDPRTSPKDKQRVRAKKKRNESRLDAAKRDLLKGLREQLREVSGRGEWALSELGVRRAKALREKYDAKFAAVCGPNATAKFLGENWERYYGRITLHLRRKMPRSEELGKIDDHAMNWIERAIKRDSLRSRLYQGVSIPPSQVSAWARRGAYTDIRNEGREPVARVFHGALTKKEIDQHDPRNWTEVHIPRTINDSENLTASCYTEHGEEDYVSERIDNLRDDHMMATVEETVLDVDAFDEVLDRVTEVIFEEIDETLDPDLHRQLMVEHFVREMTVAEIADQHESLDERQVELSLNRVREAMLRARDFGEFDDVIAR